jgi:hypothetical protein
VRVEDDDRDWEDDVRPVRKKGKRKKKQGNMVLLLCCIGGGVAFLVAALVLTAFVWPGFLRSRPAATRPVAVVAAANQPGAFPKGTGNEDLLAFAPADCNMVAGGNLSLLQNNPEMAQQFQLGLTAGLQQAGAPAELAAIFGDVERVLLAANTNENGTPKGAIVLGMRTPYEPERTRVLLQADKAETLQDKTYYRLSKLAKGPGPAPVVFMPNDRVLVFGAAPPEQLAGLLNANGVQPVVPADLVAQVRAVDKAMAWGTVQITGEAQQKLAQLKPEDLAAVPDLKVALPALQQLKAASFALERLPTRKTRLTISATCANASDSQQLNSAVEKVWQKQGKFYLGMAKMMIPAQANKVVTPAIDELVRSLKFICNGPNASVSLEIADATLEALQANAAQLQQMMGQGGVPGGPGFNPPAGPPGRPPGFNPPPGPPGRPPIARPKRPGP